MAASSELFHFRKQHDEFIASLPAHRVRAAYAIHQALGDGLKKLVADRMSQGIVDVLEAVQIQKQHRDSFLVTRRQGDRLADPVVQQHAIGQTGQKVVLGRMGHLQRHRPGRAHVAENDDGSGRLALRGRGWGRRSPRSEFQIRRAGPEYSSTAGARFGLARRPSPSDWGWFRELWRPGSGKLRPWAGRPLPAATSPSFFPPPG